jgi:pimeloyl-ACP methyl ester carboxylesterase
MNMMKPRSSFTAVNNVCFHCLEWDPASTRPLTTNEQDSDNVPLVLLHGLGATAETWQLTAEHLCHHRLVVAFDLRGHGESDQPEQDYDLATIAEDVVGAMATLGLGQVALAGHGWGARVALVLAARHPALISHLILVDCPHIEPRHWPGMTRERFIREKAPQDIYASFTAFSDAMREEMSNFWSPAVEAIIKTYVRQLPDGRVEERLLPTHQRQIRESLWEDRALSYYSKLLCPVLLIPAAIQPQMGEELPERLENADEFAAAKGYMAEQVARAIQRCSIMWMPDTTHEIQLQRPQVLANAIERFLTNAYPQ